MQAAGSLPGLPLESPRSGYIRKDSLGDHRQLRLEIVWPSFSQDIWTAFQLESLIAIRNLWSQFECSPSREVWAMHGCSIGCKLEVRSEHHTQHMHLAVSRGDIGTLAYLPLTLRISCTTGGKASSLRTWTRTDRKGHGNLGYGSIIAPSERHEAHEITTKRPERSISTPARYRFRPIFHPFLFRLDRDCFLDRRQLRSAMIFVQYPSLPRRSRREPFTVL